MVAGSGNDPFPDYAAKPAGFVRLCVGVNDVNSSGVNPTGHNTGPSVDVVAPGSEQAHKLQTTTTTFDPPVYNETPGYSGSGGTSSATAHISGIASLVLTHTANQGTEATNEDLIELITRRSRDLGSSGYDETYGHGLARADSILCWLEERELTHASTTGYDDTTSTLEDYFFRALPVHVNSYNLPDTLRGAKYDPLETYQLKVRRYKLTRGVTFASNPSGNAMTATDVWGRGRQCTGWGATFHDSLLVDFGEDLSWVGVVDATVTTTGCDLETYYYEIFEETAPPYTTWGWFPGNPFTAGPGSVTWAYTYLFDPTQPRTASSSDPHLSSSVTFELLSSEPVAISIFEVGGRLVRQWEETYGSPGRHKAFWDGRTSTGQYAPLGVYFLQVTQAGRSAASGSNRTDRSRVTGRNGGSGDAPHRWSHSCRCVCGRPGLKRSCSQTSGMAF